jgi:transposase
MSRVFTEEFKQDAVRMVKRSDRSCSQISSDLGISYWTLRNWCKDQGVKKGSKKASSSKAAAAPLSGETLQEKVKRLERENALLRKEKESLEMDRAILKKAAAFFAKESE